MKLQGINVNLARNKFEYEKYVSAEIKKTKPWSSESSKAPFIVIDFYTGNGESDVSEVQVTMTPEANFTGVVSPEDSSYVKDTDQKKLNVDLTKLKTKQIVLQAKTECGYAAAPLSLIAKATLPGHTFTTSYFKPNISDKDDTLDIIDRVLIQGGACDPTVAQLIYELVAQQGNSTAPAGISEAPADGKAYVRKNKAWVQETVGLTDAPKDSKAYVRKNNTWVQETVGLTDAPNDGKAYVRKSRAWVQETVGISEAPNDGKLYGRKSQAWAEAAEQVTV